MQHLAIKFDRLLKHVEYRFHKKIEISSGIGGWWLFNISKLPITSTQISFPLPSPANYFLLFII